MSAITISPENRKKLFIIGFALSGALTLIAYIIARLS